MNNKATHSGTCQACGSFQKLPGGVLSKHGYTKKYGFFEGTCMGAGHNPLETHCDLIVESIEAANRQIDVLEKRIVAVLEGSDMWLSKATRYGYMFYKATNVTYANNMLRYTAQDAWGKPWERTQFVYADDLASVVRERNREYIKNMRGQIDSARTYIAQQKEVLRNWAPRPLKPVE